MASCEDVATEVIKSEEEWMDDVFWIEVETIQDLIALVEKTETSLILCDNFYFVWKGDAIKERRLEHYEGAGPVYLEIYDDYRE
jgi:hypothetical protein